MTGTRSTALLALLALLPLGCAMADIGEGDDPGLDEIEFAADNGIFLDNGLNLPNGMNLGNGTALSNGMNLGNGVDLSNGMNLGNGLDLGNGITGPYYAPPAGSGLEQWIDIDPPMRKKILRYLVECALPAGVDVQLRYRGALEHLGTGILGLGSSLQQGAMPQDEQEGVSSCMLARINGSGDRVSIDLFGPYPYLDSSSHVDALYSRFEAVYFGNIFAPEPQASVCTVAERNCNEVRGCKALPDGSCDCGVLGAAPGRLDCGSGFHADLYGWNGSACSTSATPDGTHYYMTDCADGLGRIWSAPITVWFAPQANGTSCRYDQMCESYACVGNSCQAKGANGSFCDSRTDCQSGYCVDDACGLPSGSYCTSSSQCRSNSCSRKRGCL